eukprot:gene7420-10112_t
MEKQKVFPISGDDTAHSMLNGGETPPADGYSVIDESIWNDRSSKYTFKWYFQFIPIVTYVLLITISIIMENSSNYPMCKESINYSYPLFQTLSSSTAFCFFVFCICNIGLMLRVLFSSENKKFLLPIYLALVSICFISGSTMLLLYLTPSGVCKDVFRIPSSTYQWIEWTTTVPLLTYLGAIVGSEQGLLHQDDLNALLSSFFMIIFGFVSAVTKTDWISYFGYFLSCLFFVMTIIQLERSGEERYEGNLFQSKNTSYTDLLAEIESLRKNGKKFRMRLLMVIFAIFPVLHILGCVGFIQPEDVLCGYMLFGCIGKLMFGKFLVNTHIFLQNETAKIVSKHKTKSLKTMFEQELEEFRHSIANAAHDLKTPLAGFCSGIDFIESVVEDILSGAVEQKKSQSKSIDDFVDLKFDEDIEANAKLVLDAIKNVKNLISNNFQMLESEERLGFTTLEVLSRTSTRSVLDGSSVYTGIGLSQIEANSLFSPFKQAMRHAGGTGLGLFSLAKRVDALNGYYGVKNRTDGGSGTLFWFAIPYRPDHQQYNSFRSSNDSLSIPDSSVDQPTEKKVQLPGLDIPNVNQISALKATPMNGATPTNGTPARKAKEKLTKKLNILIVDDSIPIQKMTASLLKHAGHTVDIVENGALALEKVSNCINQNQKINFNDENTSSTTISRIHQIIIGCSANSDYDTSQAALASGIDVFLEKPFTLKKFYDSWIQLTNNNNNNNEVKQ